MRQIVVHNKRGSRMLDCLQLLMHIISFVNYLVELLTSIARRHTADMCCNSYEPGTCDNVNQTLRLFIWSRLPGIQ
jgi:hypothetical protein